MPPRPSPLLKLVLHPYPSSQRAGLTHDQDDIGDLLLGQDNVTHSSLQLIVPPVNPLEEQLCNGVAGLGGLSCSSGGGWSSRCPPARPQLLYLPEECGGQLDGENHTAQSVGSSGILRRQGHHFLGETCLPSARGFTPAL